MKPWEPTHSSEKKQTDYVPEHEYTVADEKTVAAKAVAALEDILDVFSNSVDVANMKDLEEPSYKQKEREAERQEDSWSMNEDADYGMFRREHFDEEDSMKAIKEYWSRRRTEE